MCWQWRSDSFALNNPYGKILVPISQGKVFLWHYISHRGFKELMVLSAHYCSHYLIMIIIEYPGDTEPEPRPAGDKLLIWWRCQEQYCVSHKQGLLSDDLEWRIYSCGRYLYKEGFINKRVDPSHKIWT